METQFDAARQIAFKLTSEFYEKLIKSSEESMWFQFRQTIRAGAISDKEEAEMIAKLESKRPQIVKLLQRAATTVIPTVPMIEICERLLRENLSASALEAYADFLDTPKGKEITAVTADIAKELNVWTTNRMRAELENLEAGLIPALELILEED